MSEQLGPASLPMGLRAAVFRAPKTPEPMAEGETRPPSPPRPRFRLKRRNVSQHLAAPTQQFLASVAAADVPIPSIEEPEVISLDSDVDTSFTGLNQLSDDEMAVPFEFRGTHHSPAHQFSGVVVLLLLANA